MILAFLGLIESEFFDLAMAGLSAAIGLLAQGILKFHCDTLSDTIR